MQHEKDVQPADLSTEHDLKGVELRPLITEKDGETRYADVMVYPLLANGMAGAVIRIDDITNRVRIEQMMVQTEKMMSVGGLAAGMAHEINNPLSGVLQSSQNIQRRISAELEANRETAESLGIDLQLVYRYLEERGILEFIESIRQAASRASPPVPSASPTRATSSPRSWSAMMGTSVCTRAAPIENWTAGSK